jgi:nitroimidazol reductase NimA-like FMN-containing flavoprotein (pyridoxamine 5'-phosphate oxidase superfamily)
MTTELTATNELVELSREECLKLLASIDFGRLAVSLGDGAPVIRAVNYVFDGPSQCVVFRTAAGTKLHALIHAREAAFEVDAFDATSRTGWSVVVRGVPMEVTDPREIQRLDALALDVWNPAPCRHWARIRARTVSGRRIERARPAT